MAIENFLTYTEVDLSERLTVTAPKAEGVDVDQDIDVYLYKDKGADHFDALDIDFELYIASTSLDNSFSGMAIANIVSTQKDFAVTDLSVVCNRVVGPAYRVTLRRGAAQADNHYTGSADTLYYCTLLRAAGNNTATVKIYSDSARTDLLDTLSLAGFGATKYRYVYGFVNWNHPASGNDWDGYVQNLDLKEVVGRSFGYIIG